MLKKKKEFKRLLVRDSKAKNNGLFISTERARSARRLRELGNGSRQLGIHRKNINNSTAKQFQ